MNTPSPSRWSELFDVAMSIIAQANKHHDVVGRWTFGGGTALMLQINHRESHDVDFFLEDAQVLPYLNPQTQAYELKLSPSNYQTDGAGSLKIIFDGVGEIDFICCLPALDGETVQRDVDGTLVDLETPAEIVAKKVFYRGARLQPRDIFDIAAVAQYNGGEYLAQPLSRFPEKVEAALGVTERYQQSILDSVLGGLNIESGYEAVRQSARDDTMTVLREALRVASRANE